MGGEEAPVRTERARFLSAGEKSEVRTGADFLAGENQRADNPPSLTL